ncbi:MAG: hypothetical protein ABW034_16675 [Steroidobacteraceae bacterium]
MNSKADIECVRRAHEEWRRYVEPFLSVGPSLVAEMADGDDPLLRHELYARLMAAVSQASMGLFLGDADHPDFWPIFGGATNFGAPNPDGTYLLAPLDGTGTYRLSGFRGTVVMSDFQFGGGYFYPRAQGPVAPSLANYDLAQIEVDGNGQFEVLLSAERPQGHQGNWWYMDPHSTHVLVRQWSYDWVNEVDGRFAIERMDRPAIRPRPCIEQLSRDLSHISAWMENTVRTSMAIANRYLAQGLVNLVAVRDLSGIGGLSNSKQLYVEGQFDLNPDEALIYTTSVPAKCRYWGVQLTDLLSWGAIDYVNRQSSLNGHTAGLDTEGRLRAVISIIDPQVPNWLDTGGLQRGTIFGRWTQCDSQPVPTVDKVKLADLRRHLPQDTPVVTAEARDAQLRLRRKGAQLRRRW